MAEICLTSLTGAANGDTAEPAHIAAAVGSMKHLNRRAAQLIQQTVSMPVRI